MGIFRFQPSRAQVLALDGIVDFLAVDRDFRGGINAKAHFIAADIDNGDNNVVANDDAFVALSRQNKHRELLPSI
jgi:hypothetical protein